MHLEKVTLKNYKAFDDLEIDLQPGINLLVGDNGAGKTSVLDGIAVALGGPFCERGGSILFRLNKKYKSLVRQGL